MAILRSSSAAAAAIAIFALSAAVGSRANAQELSGTLKKAKETGTLVIGHRESSIPFSYVDDKQQAIGYGIDICDRIVQAIKAQIKSPELKVSYQTVTSQNRIPLIVNGTIDLECGSTTNNSERQKQVAFSINYFYTGTRLLSKKSAKVVDYADVRGKNVVSTIGTTNARVLRQLNADRNLDMNIVLAKDHAESFLLVETERAVAFAMDDILLYGLRANAKNPDDFEVVAPAVQIEPYAIMLRKDDPALKKIVDDTIAALMKSGELNKLYTKWFQSPIPPKNINLNVPMSKEMRDNITAPSDKPTT